MEQEFAVQFEPEEIEQLLSFESIHALLEAKFSRNGSSS